MKSGVKRLAELLASASLPLVVLDREGRILAASEGALALVGHERDALTLGMSVECFLRLDDPLDLFSLASRAERRTPGLEVHSCDAEGAPLRLRLGLAPLVRQGKSSEGLLVLLEECSDEYALLRALSGIAVAVEHDDWSHRLPAHLARGPSKEIARGIDSLLRGLRRRFEELDALIDEVCRAADLEPGNQERDSALARLRLLPAQLERARVKGAGFARGISLSADEIDVMARELAREMHRHGRGLALLRDELGKLKRGLSYDFESARQLREIAGTSLELAGAHRRSTRELREMLERMERASEKCATIVRTIDEIAAQTKLLALNASVEAARAGQAGRGFEVVAAGMGALAGRSAEAAHETSELIAESIEKARRGARLHQEVERQGARLGSEAADKARLAELISESCGERSDTLELIVQRLVEAGAQAGTLADVAEQTAAAVEELGARSCGLPLLLSDASSR